MGAGLRSRAIKPQKASLIFLRENKEQKNIHQTTISLARDGAFVYPVMRPTSRRGAQKLQETNGTSPPMTDKPEAAPDADEVRPRGAKLFGCCA